MKIVNTSSLPELIWDSPKGRFAGAGKQVSEALGRQPRSTDLNERHPFDLEICRVPPGKAAFPYHAHSAQWEFYLVISGQGNVRHAEGTTLVGPGDAFLFKPGEPHQISNPGPADLIFQVIADNPVGECCHYPDSGKWFVPIPARSLVRSAPLDYYDGEE